MSKHLLKMKIELSDMSPQHRTGAIPASQNGTMTLTPPFTNLQACSDGCPES